MEKKLYLFTIHDKWKWNNNILFILEYLKKLEKYNII